MGQTFENPLWVVFYVLAMVVAAVHVSHGFWSAFQTLGPNHPIYVPVIRAVGIAFAVAIGIGFGFLPIYIFLLA